MSLASHGTHSIKLSAMPVLSEPLVYFPRKKSVKIQHNSNAIKFIIYLNNYSILVCFARKHV